MERMKTEPSFAIFKPLEIWTLGSRLRSTKGFPFEFELGSRLVHEMGSATKTFKNPTT
jgi:hypothetical protein